MKPLRTDGVWFLVFIRFYASFTGIIGREAGGVGREIAQQMVTSHEQQIYTSPQ
jgi:hypothetical protein